MRRTMLPTVVFFLLLWAPAARAAEGNDIVGIWNTAEKDAVIEIFRCGEKYCGRIAWVKDPNYTGDDKRGREGQPRVDDNNPDPLLRNRPIAGLQLMSDFSFTGGNTWTDGRVYDPKSGKTYRGRITLTSRNTLDLRGYAIFSLFGRTATWTRVGQ